MFIIVPINIEALRVSPSSLTKGKKSLYDFNSIEESPLSTKLCAANNFENAEMSLGDEPGIHLHWSLPKAYTQGRQDKKDGRTNFPSLPNRWLVTRFLHGKTGKDPSSEISKVTSWVLESDVHIPVTGQVADANTAIPWMDDSSKLNGITYHSAGETFLLDPASSEVQWQEPGVSSSYLGTDLQAPFGYGETFTAYYRNCRNVFGMYDDFHDIFPTNRYQMEQGCNFFVSYVVAGWVSQPKNDFCIKTLTEAIKEYSKSSGGGKDAGSKDEGSTDFVSYIRQVFEQQLKWQLSDYSSFTPENAVQLQPVMSGIVAAIEWSPDAKNTYPSSLPDGRGISTSIGNTMPEAVSAYLNAIEQAKTGSKTSGDSGGVVNNSDPGEAPDNSDPGDVLNNMEWLLNAMQTGRLPYLGNGETGIGQLEEYLHSKAFASRNGGSIWTVRGLMKPGDKPDPKRDVERALPAPLSDLLAVLNDCQENYDRLGDQIASRQKKCFFDWNYHIHSIELNVINPPHEDITQDCSRDYLMDGLMNLFPLFISAGARGKTTAQDGPYLYKPHPFRMQLPATAPDGYPSFPDLSGYRWNKTVNKGAEAAGTGLLRTYCQLSALPDELQRLGRLLRTALQVLDSGPPKSTLTAADISQAIAALEEAKGLAQTLAGNWENGGGPSAGLTAIGDQVSGALERLATFTDPQQGLFAKYLVVQSNKTVPLDNKGVYTGTMDDPSHLNVSYWETGQSDDGFPGMGDCVDQCTGQGGYKHHLFDVQVAGLYLAVAYFWNQSGEQVSTVVPYYIQMAQQEIADAQSLAQTADTALQNSINFLNGGICQNFARAIASLGEKDIPAMLAELGVENPDAEQAATTIRQWLTKGSAGEWAIPDMIAAVRTTEWQNMIGQIRTVWAVILQRLPQAHQVSLLGNFLAEKIKGHFEVSHMPATPFWEPTEPVLLLAEDDSPSQLLKPVDRNGMAALFPCRLDTQLVQGSGDYTLPEGIGNLAARVDPLITGMDTLLQNLLQEAFFLTPEFNTGDEVKTLYNLANDNETSQVDQTEPSPPKLPPSLCGDPGAVLPYYTAYNWWAGADPFLPLYIFWKVEYVFSQRFNDSGRKLSAGSLTDFTPDPAGIDYLPTENNLSFQKGKNIPNFLTLSGTTSLSSAGTANLCNQIRQYCLNNLHYDPENDGAPTGSDPESTEKLDLYKAYKDFNTRHLLSQSLSGFNAGMLQRVQDLQLPVNIPSFWTHAGHLQPGDLWPSQFLMDQSAGWPRPWKSEALDVDSLDDPDGGPYFNPLRAGFLQVQNILLVDAFGQFIPLSGTIPGAIAETMQTQAVAVQDHPIYLPPRLVQPSRLMCDWVPAGPSPVCGWLLPNHLDDSLMVYNSDGKPLGSVSHANDGLLWLTVPGEPYKAGSLNRELMTNALESANPDFAAFFRKFIYPDHGSDITSNFQQFLTVIESAGQFVITKAMQEDPGLAVLIGQPLVMARATLKWRLKGLPNVSLDQGSFPPWSGSSDQFQLNNDGYIPYNFDRFNDAGIKDLRIPISIGAVNHLLEQQQIVFFDDGLVGYFINDDYNCFYTPVNLDDGGNSRIRTTRNPAGQPAGQPVMLKPEGGEMTVTFIMDPRAAVHISSGLLPVYEMVLPQQQYLETLNNLLVTFLTAPVLEGSDGLKIPLPAETRYDWSWWQTGAAADNPLYPTQLNTDAFFVGGRQRLIDGWLKLKKSQIKHHH